MTKKYIIMSQIGSNELHHWCTINDAIEIAFSWNFEERFILGGFDDDVEYYVITDLDEIEMRSSGCEQNMAAEMKPRHKFEPMESSASNFEDMPETSYSSNYISMRLYKPPILFCHFALIKKICL